MLGALGEFQGIRRATLGIRKVTLGMRQLQFSELHFHGLWNAKPTLLGEIPGAIPSAGSKGKPQSSYPAEVRK